MFGKRDMVAASGEAVKQGQDFVRGFEMRHVAGAFKEVEGDSPRGAERVFPRDDLILAAPDDPRLHIEAAKGGVEVKALHPIGKESLRHGLLGGAFSFVAAGHGGGLDEGPADRVGIGGELFHPRAEAFAVRRTGEPGDGVAVDLGAEPGGRDQRQARHLPGARVGEGEGQSAAEGMADEMAAFEAEIVEAAAEQGGQIGEIADRFAR